ncbi:MAG: FAD-dependent oxidoreductase, partial [Candidatus Omnitrophica bacterium]|nr:FAD-dependent oxidoreductase [Candidatus Omnitrophota bacterium]
GEKIRVVTGQAVSRINLKRNQLVLENKEQFSFDVLVLADLGSPRFNEIKGIQKHGVYHAARLDKVREIMDQMIFAQTIVLQLSNIQGFLTLCALSQYAKEIIVTCSQESLLGGLLDGECSSMLKQFLEMKGMRLLMGTSIEEILGDSDLKAVRLTSGKVLSAEMVVLDDLRCDTRILKETGLEYQAQQDGGMSYRSNMANVFWVDAVKRAYCEPDKNHYDVLDKTLENQAMQLVSEIFNASQPSMAQETRFVLRFAFKDMKGCWFGNAMGGPDVQEHSRYDPESNVYMKFFLNQGRLTGGFVMGHETVCEKCVTLFENQAVIQAIEEELFGEFREKVLVDAQQQG